MPAGLLGGEPPTRWCGWGQPVFDSFWGRADREHQISHLLMVKGWRDDAYEPCLFRSGSHFFGFNFFSSCLWYEFRNTVSSISSALKRRRNRWSRWRGRCVLRRSAHPLGKVGVPQRSRRLWWKGIGSGVRVSLNHSVRSGPCRKR